MVLDHRGDPGVADQRRAQRPEAPAPAAARGDEAECRRRAEQTVCALGRQADSLQWVLMGSLAVPVAITWLVLRRTLQTPSREL